MLAPPPGFSNSPPVPQSSPALASPPMRVEGPLTPEIRSIADSAAKELCKQEEAQRKQEFVIRQRTENIAAMIYAQAVKDIPHTDLVGLAGAGNAAIRKAVVFAQNVLNYGISLGPSSGPNGEAMPPQGELFAQETAQAQDQPQQQPSPPPRSSPVPGGVPIPMEQLQWQAEVTR